MMQLTFFVCMQAIPATNVHSTFIDSLWVQKYKNSERARDRQSVRKRRRESERETVECIYSTWEWVRKREYGRFSTGGRIKGKRIFPCNVTATEGDVFHPVVNNIFPSREAHGRARATAEHMLTASYSFVVMIYEMISIRAIPLPPFKRLPNYNSQARCFLWIIFAEKLNRWLRDINFNFKKRRQICKQLKHGARPPARSPQYVQWTPIKFIAHSAFQNRVIN